MSTILFDKIVFGPVKSRRLGISLGINLLPVDGKLCSFDCIYCECGLNAQGKGSGIIPTRKEVKDALSDKLQQMLSSDEKLDVITFAGNGEPTIHPDFAGIIDDTIELRNRYFPDAEISVLSNSSMIHKPDVFDALNKIDKNILKLDGVDDDYIRLVDQPQNKSFRVNELIDNLKKFEGNLIIQTMFIEGFYNGKNLDNTSEQQVNALIDILKEIKPQSIMIYTIARETPTKGIQKVSFEKLNRIAKQLENAGLKVQVSG